MNQELELVPGLLREWMGLVRRRRLIFVAACVAVIGAVLVNTFARPVYQGVAVISVSESIPGSPLARLTTDPQRLKVLADKEISRLTSLDFATRVVKQATNEARAELATGALGPWYTRVRGMSDETPADESAVDTANGVSALLTRVAPDWREQSNWISVRVSAYDPAAAAQLANLVATAYIADTKEINRRNLEETQADFDTQVERRGQDLGERLADLRQRGQESGLGDVAGKKAVLERQVRGFQDALVAAQTARVGRAATAKEASRLDGGALAAGSDQRILAAQSRVSELEDRERGLQATLGSKHPEVITVQEQLQAARVRLNAAIADVEKAAQNAYQLALNEESRIEANLTRVQRELAALEQQSLDLSLGQKRADASRVAVDQLIQRQESSPQLQLDAELIQSAARPRSPASPQKRRNLLYGLVGGLAMGVALAWLLDRLDDTIQSPDDIKGMLGLPFLGMIPMVPKLAQSGFSEALAQVESGFADGLRVVRTNLMFTAAEPRPKVFVFTSASPGDGKSTVATGIALLLRETEGSVLLIDGDLRRPTIHQLMKVPQSPGLSNLLAATPSVGLPRELTSADGIDVLPSGPSLTASSARLGSDNMKQAIAEARRRYDWVIIDSPPSLALPDAAVLATLADGVIIVSSGDKTPRQALMSVTDQLRSVGASLLGVVLNRVDTRRHSYYRGRHYSPYYGEASTSTKSEVPRVPAEWAHAPRRTTSEPPRENPPSPKQAETLDRSPEPSADNAPKGWSPELADAPQADRLRPRRSAGRRRKN